MLEHDGLLVAFGEAQDLYRLADTGTDGQAAFALTFRPASGEAFVAVQGRTLHPIPNG